MGTGTQVNVDWAGVDAAQVNAPVLQPSAPSDAGTGGGKFLSDEEILGMDPVGQAFLPVPEGAPAGASNLSTRATGNSSDAALDAPRLEGQAGMPVLLEAPRWLQAAAGDPQHGAEAQQLWQEHQEFRAAFSSPAEARTIRELFPGGAQEAQTLKQASQSVERIDAAIFSGDTRAQSEVVAELARANPAAFRSLFAEAARVLSSMGQGQPAFQENPTFRQNREGWGTQNSSQLPPTQQPAMAGQPQGENRRPFLRQGEQDSGVTTAGPTPGANYQSQVTNHPSQELRAPGFDPVAYSSFERSTNEAVARDVRSAIHDTLARVLPDGVAEGAARRMIVLDTMCTHW